MNNKEHTLVILGDIFDRGEETRNLYSFLKNIPEERLVLVKGNHEYLLEELLEKDLPDSYDFSNGTVFTCCQIAFNSLNVAKKNRDLIYELTTEIKYYKYWKGFSENSNLDTDIIKVAKRKWKSTIKRVKSSEIYKWYINSKWVNYWETASFVGVHSFVPVNFDSHFSVSKERRLNAIYYGDTNSFSLDFNWRNADKEAWELATWGCPYVYMDANLFSEKGKKTLICGHFNTASFHSHYENFTYNKNDIYFSKYIIALDSSVASSKQTNVLVLDENNNCFDQYNKKLII